MATYDITTQTVDPSKLKSGDILNCPYKSPGQAYSIKLPKGTYKLEVWGAQGGTTTNSSYAGTGGKGGYSIGQLEISENKMFYLYSGGHPSNISSGTNSGGFNGGGATTDANYGPAQGGGGGSDIRIGQNSLYARIIVAGGGGGGYSENSSNYYGSGGVGGGTSGTAYTTLGSSSTAGTAGTQTSGYGLVLEEQALIVEAPVEVDTVVFLEVMVDHLVRVDLDMCILLLLLLHIHQVVF